MRLKVHVSLKFLYHCCYFNSSEVRLKECAATKARAGLSRFQFQWGAIEGIDLITLVSKWKIFQFQWGAIEGRVVDIYGDWAYSHFNSSEVRLKELLDGQFQVKLFYFNSSEVRLKVGRLSEVDRNPGRFQFQWGAIEGITNSTEIVIDSTFQFQWGAIEGLRTFTMNGVCLKFQFQWGAIEGVKKQNIEIASKLISIPVRCDWRAGARSQGKTGKSISIPVRCDWRYIRVPIGLTRLLFQFQWGAIEGTGSVME